MLFSTGGGVLSTIAVRLVRPVRSGGPGFVPFFVPSPTFSAFAWAVAHQSNKELRAAPSWAGLARLFLRVIGTVDGRQNTTGHAELRTFAHPGHAGEQAEYSSSDHCHHGAGEHRVNWHQ